MNAPRRNRARVLTPDGLKQLRERVRSHENEENSGFKYTLERLGELTGLDPETVKNVLDGNGSDKRTIARCFETFGLILADNDHMPAAPATAAQADPNFVGREDAIADLTTLVSRKANLIVIQARGGVGKTTLARKYLQQEFGSYLEFPIAKETKDIASIEGLIEEKLRQLGEEPGREFLVSLDRLKRKLQGDRIGILIDNLEPALDSTGKFIEAHRRYLELLRVLNDPTVQSLTLITTRERLREPAITVHHYGLKSLDVQAWSQFFQSRNIQLTPLSCAESKGEGALAALHNAYGGNAKAMDLISGVILEDFAGETEAYWQANQNDLLIERDLEDLVTHQFNRLQQLDPDAYQLLCRMGCYRYQDVPNVPIEGLFCLLWDIPENRHRRVIKSLQDRSLIDCENGEFWLHPVIRAEAIARLRSSETWEITNREAARFWTEGTITVETLEDALRAFEAYYHYLEVYDFEKAGEVVIEPRDNQQIIDERLSTSFYRLGLVQKVIDTINPVIDHVNEGTILAPLYDILSSVTLVLGDIRKSFDYENLIFEIASNYNIDFYKISSLQKRGFCNIYLGELEQAKQCYAEALLMFEVIHDNFLKPRSLFFLAFLNSCLGYQEEARDYAEKSHNKLNKLLYLPSQASAYSKGFGFLFLGLAYKNLGEYQKSFEMYNRAISYSEETHYYHLKAKVLYCLSELYRGQEKFEVALSHNLDSIELLRKFSLKCDLPEAYYQLGLTYQAMSETEKSDESFQEAIRLFSEMEAPKQVERVRRS